ncbi:PREDICTED: mitochondrial intermediate peptidase [Polistes canadensis]|uniref:mitochondrial intermediate peptidase n=1 Tax=Polistes canadensis TaxID=91411 RepID=UPI000718C7E8|nr:PREDICTED: mitochondrial intermediate peptidase [Polistes canadensis]
MMQTLNKRILKYLNVYRHVNTWSPLATAFNSIRKIEHGLDFSKKETGLFGILQLKDANGFQTLKDQVFAQTDSLIAEVTDVNRKRNMVEIFDELSDTLCKVADLSEFIRIAHPNIEFVEAAEDTSISLSSVVEKLNTHSELYDALQHVVKNGDIFTTSPIDDHVAKLFLFDFEQSGIHLPEEQRQQVVMLNDDILQTGQKFMAGAVNARSVKADILPENIKQNFQMDNGQILINGLYTDSSDTIVREAAYKLFLYPDEQQDYLLIKLLNCRHQLAQTCGFPTYAHRAVRGSTVQTPEAVNDFLNILNNDLRSKAMQDFQEMQTMKDAESSVKQDLMPWDTAYFMSLAKKTWLNTSSNEFAPYFSLGSCMDGLNYLVQALYGIRLESVPTLSGEVWAPNIHKLAVIDKDETTLGYIYCDFFERKGKPNQDCHFAIRGGKQLSDGTYQTPIVVIMLSLSLPRWSNPCLLSPSSVDNLFHEMGHALHSMLGRTKYQHVTGTRCSTDFAEVPSVLMEYFASDSRVLSMFAKHYQTNEPIPDNLLQKLCASKHIFCASELQNQVFYSMLDHVYHSNKLKRSTTEILKDIQEKYYGLPYIENTAWQLRFSHLVGYGAKYYSYLISRAIASWIWQTYFQNDPLSRVAGEKYRWECLTHGGGKPPSLLVSDFLHKTASPSNFANSLLNEIDIRNEYVKTIKKLK